MPRISKKSKKQAEEPQICTVCMDRPINCKPDECSHQFCYRCLSKWGRRQGNCPLCRTKIRKIHYKKKVIEPQYLKFFDEIISMSSDPSNDSEEPVERPAVAPPQPAPRNVVFMVPLYTHVFPLPYMMPFQMPSMQSMSSMLSNNW